ncbi:MAG: hypothetical protein ILP17_03900 [Lachnospiraceae bacterium]|nr:hypothetical protein [Lachnospiraceae bacterium]
MIPEDKLKTAFEEIDKGNIDAAKMMLDEYKGINPGDWRLPAGYYFASGKDDKEYIMKAARSAHEAEGIGADVTEMLDELSSILWGIEDGSDEISAARTDKSRAEKKSKDRIINIIIGIVFIIGGCVGLIPGTMNVLSVILIFIGIILLIVQIRSFFYDKAPTEDSDPQMERKNVLSRKTELDRNILRSITRTLG